MQRIHLPAAVFILLFSCVVAFAQHSGSLVVKDDQNDPCRRFKMRILAPSPDIDPQLEVSKPDAQVDYKMRIINPCLQQMPQVAIIIPERLPEGEGFFAPPRFKAGSSPVREGQQPSLAPPGARQPSVMEMMRGGR